ncbi:MAG: DUF5368 family protein [Rubrivivax sp.]|nr:DUF5368 family protein [Rubrivivax sp.]
MYEIWLMLNIVWENALLLWPVLLGAAVLWAVAMALAWRRPGRAWRAGLPHALAAGVVVAVLATLLMPGWVGSSLSDMGYWVDWAILLTLAAGCGAAAAALAWPLAALRHAR